MSKIFYDHLILVEELFIEIDELDIHKSEKKQAKKLIDETIHHHVLTHILDLLPKEHHTEFLVQFHEMPFDPKLLKYIDSKIEKNIHQEIAKLGKKIKREIMLDIKKHAKKK